MKRSLTVLVLGSLCVVSTALATTYMRVEKDGTKTYSDRPIPGGTVVELKPAQSYSSPPSSGTSTLAREEPDNEFRYQSCTVTPENDSTFTNPEIVSIALSTNPAVRPFDTVIMKVDGQTVGQPGTISWTLQAPIDRGTHTVSVTITDRGGVTMCSVNSSFHVMRPSVNSPGPNRPPRPNVPRPMPH